MYKEVHFLYTIGKEEYNEDTSIMFRWNVYEFIGS